MTGAFTAVGTRRSILAWPFALPFAVFFALLFSLPVVAPMQGAGANTSHSAERA
jgi:hypothetical protein